MARRIGTNAYLLDDYGEPPLISVYLIADDGLILIDPGPRSISDEVIKGIRDAGFDPRDLKLILLTHIHLDHSGGVWYFLKNFPKTRVVVHPAGAKHLIDPSRLLSSSKEVLGQSFYSLGEVRPCDPSRISGATHAQKIEVQGRSLTPYFTPGHAPHHLSFFEEKDLLLFSGDALGIQYEDCQALVPASPLPSFDYDQAMKDMDFIAFLKPARIALPHFDVTEKVNATLKLNREVYSRWFKVVEECEMKGYDMEKITESLIKEFPEYEGIKNREERMMMMKVDIAGFQTYVRKRLQKKV